MSHITFLGKSKKQRENEGSFARKRSREKRRPRWSWIAFKRWMGSRKKKKRMGSNSLGEAGEPAEKRVVEWNPKEKGVENDDDEDEKCFLGGPVFEEEERERLSH